MVNLAYKDSSETLNLHELADVAPFILENAGLPVPAVMRKKDLSDK
jgi:bisphosphoglycerate-independent phosphoglycerate mutase (AlkP superfamily)